MCHSNSDFVHVKCIFNLFSSKRIAVTRAQNGATHLTMHGNDFRTEIVRWGELELNGNKRTWIEWLEKWWLKLPKMFVRITSHGFRFRLRSMEASGACARSVCVTSPSVHNKHVRNDFTEHETFSFYQSSETFACVRDARGRWKSLSPFPIPLCFCLHSLTVTLRIVISFWRGSYLRSTIYRLNCDEQMERVEIL